MTACRTMTCEYVYINYDDLVTVTGGWSSVSV